MLDTKLIGIVKTFSRSEMGRWRDFVRSPYHNKNQYVTTLAHFVEKRYPKFHPAKTTKERAFAFIFPQLKYNDLRLRHLVSLLLKVTEEFLVVQSVRQNGVSKNIKLMEAFQKRNLGKHFEASGRIATELQNSRPESDIYYHYHQFRIELQREMFLDQKVSGRRKITGFQKVSDHLDAFYLINKLKQCCFIVNHRNVYGQQYELKMMDEMLSHLKTKKYHIPLINLYHMGLLSLIDPQEENHFFSLKEMLEKNKTAVLKEEAAELHAIARNYAIKRMNTGDNKYGKPLFELYKLGLVSNVLYDSRDIISPGAYKNIVGIGLKLKEFKWTEKFIREFSKQLEEQYQKDFFNYNLAKLFFEKQEYGKVIEMLREVEFKDIFITMDARTLLIKTYFELDEYETLSSQLDSFRQFIARRKELAYHSKNYLNTTRFTRQLIQLRPGDKKAIENLRKKIDSEQVLTEKAWLLQKCAAEV